jgi:hypothetical protein
MRQHILKCLTCPAMIGDEKIFCGPCLQAAGPEARRVWYLAFPYARPLQYARRDPDQRAAVDIVRKAVIWAKTQTSLF